MRREHPWAATWRHRTRCMSSAISRTPTISLWDRRGQAGRSAKRRRPGPPAAATPDASAEVNAAFSAFSVVLASALLTSARRTRWPIGKREWTGAPPCVVQGGWPGWGCCHPQAFPARLRSNRTIRPERCRARIGPCGWLGLGPGCRDWQPATSCRAPGTPPANGLPFRLSGNRRWHPDHGEESWLLRAASHK